MTIGAEQIERFECFGSSCAVLVDGADGERSAREAVLDARRSLERWHRRFSRFLPDSELSLLNADPRRVVPASALLVRLAAAVRFAGELSGGLVDATLVGQIERAGYAGELGERLTIEEALALAPRRRAATASTAAEWRAVEVDTSAGTIKRPPGVRIDSGGLAKGLFADVLAARLSGHAGFAVDCAGDLALGGRARIARRVRVESPFEARVLHTFELREQCVATSGITRRSWRAGDGSSAHHLLDPGSGRPAFTGIVQTTALAPSALEAEVRAKAALLAGPRAARAQLRHGGVIVLEDGSHEVIAPLPAPSSSTLARFANARAQRFGHNRRDESGPDRRGVRARQRAGARGAARARGLAPAHAGRRRRRRRARRRASRSRRCCRRAASTRSNRRCRSCPAARSPASSAARPRARPSSPAIASAAFCALGGFAETAVAPEFFTFALSPELDFAQGAGLILNYHTAYFSLVTARPPAGGRDGARPRRRRRRRHRGAAGRQGTRRAHDRARLQRGQGARRRGGRRGSTWCCSRGWKDQVKELSGGGVDMVLDPVGGDRFTDSLRSLREDGRLVVVGFTGGSIPEVKVNRLLLRNTEVSEPAGAPT